MRLRHKPWALPEMKEQEIFINDFSLAKGKWKEIFGNENPIDLELGCGKGDFIIQKATSNPERNFVAIDSKNEVLVYAVRKVMEKNLKNVRFLSMNIEKIEDAFEEDETSDIYINFCNPWPKKSHHKRRLTHPNFLKKYRKISKDNSKVYFKTDDYDLYEASNEYFTEENFKILFKTDDLKENEENNIVTEYEKKFRSFGMPINMIEAVMLNEEDIKNDSEE